LFPGRWPDLLFLVSRYLEQAFFTAKTKGGRQEWVFILKTAVDSTADERKSVQFAGGFVIPCFRD
jgi:hypothetical protein